MGKQIYLIGYQITEFLGRKLPSLKEVMSLFFHYHSSQRMTINKSALFTIKKVFELWAEAGIPTCTQSSAIRKLVHCHTLWKNLVKSKNKKQAHNKTSHFCVLIEKLFDVAHHNATKLIDKDKKLFLEGQRQSNRRGFININSQNNMEVDLISDSDVNQPNEIGKCFYTFSQS